MSVVHATFSLERTYPVPAEKVFAAWSDPVAKARWFGSGETHELDFRVGGTELTTGHTRDGHALAAHSVYHDIVPLERIVYATTLTGDDVLATVSVTTIEFRPDGEGTRLILTEQGTFLDGAEEPAWRERGTGDWLTKLGKELAS